ncbi:retroviral-like aspartic protease family protein [Geomonas sp. RF6]|uniref:retropepsin-like aspartic protease family protein n=1 Tax=Geomonas sp. RF6 TaxID=2897342 RepID=UPI001E3E8ADA|nr:retropepsin-like aspartic protease [Geomonas sp. RF6]UFS71172.1 retroviral-like aspartic protease family protein [Geomonas sp. RF6]
MADLATLLLEKGEGNGEYHRSREAALDLLTTAGIAFVRNCTTFSEGVFLLERLVTKTNDVVLRKKLRIYANQLRHRWKDADPANLSEPSWQRSRALGKVDGTLVSALIICFCFILLAGMAKPMVASLAAQRPAEAPIPAEQPEVVGVEPPASPVATPPDVPPADNSGGGYGRYTDDSGVIHLVNDPADVPAQFRSRFRVIAAGRELSGGDGKTTTPVNCTRNRVLVPVTLRYQGREARVVLLLDTGATVTTISTGVADRLGINRDALQQGTSTVADGRVVPSYQFTADLISVGPKHMPGAIVSILPGSGSDGAEGLLGMNFLKEFRYHVDFNRGVIEWGS